MVDHGGTTETRLKGVDIVQRGERRSLCYDSEGGDHYGVFMTL